MKLSLCEIVSKNVCYRVEKIPFHIRDSPICKKNRSFSLSWKMQTFQMIICASRDVTLSIHPFPPPKDGWNPDPKVCVSGVVKWILMCFYLLASLKVLFEGSKHCRLLKRKDSKSPFTKTDHSKGRVRIRNWTSLNSFLGYSPFLCSFYVSSIFSIHFGY